MSYKKLRFNIFIGVVRAFTARAECRPESTPLPPYPLSLSLSRAYVLSLSPFFFFFFFGGGSANETTFGVDTEQSDLEDASLGDVDLVVL